MSAAETAVAEVALRGSRDLRRHLHVERDRWGSVHVAVRPQVGHRHRHHPGSYAALAAVSLKPKTDRDVEIVYHRVGSIALWMGETMFEILPAEADELAAKFGFPVRRESA